MSAAGICRAAIGGGAMSGGGISGGAIGGGAKGGKGPPAWLRRLGSLPDAALARVMASLPPDIVLGLDEEWTLWAHGGQCEPEGDWRVWPMVAGRGFGKTRAGAEWVSARARESPDARIALVAATIEEAIQVMIEGNSGLIAVARADEAPVWLAARKQLVFDSGARAFLYSGEKPSRLRGPEHDFAWCDELAKWARPEETWDTLMLGLRRGDRPRTVVTTTPRAGPALRRILGLDKCAPTRGRTVENVHLPGDFIDAVTAAYAGTRFARQELDGELIEDAEGAMWTREAIEKGRVEMATVMAEGFFERIVIGVDPPASAGGDECGIVACGLGADGIGYVLGDHSVGGLGPEGWARAVVDAAEQWEADLVIAETNQGGEMVESVLRSVDSDLPVQPVWARYGKGRRAEPVSGYFAQGKAKLAGAFPVLEDQLCGMTGAGYQGPGRSPDRADAMVWAMAELLLGGGRGPRIRRL
jgi:phage terminase large subunit-like protein